MCEDGEECKGSVRKLGPEELAEIKLRWEKGTPIEPDENGNFRVPFRFSIDLKDWRGFTGTQIEKVGMGD